MPNLISVASCRFVILSFVLSFACSNQLLGQDATAKGIGIEKAFPQLRFERPVDFTHAGDGTDRIFVVEQAGVIRVFENGTDPTVCSTFLDISDRVSRRGNEEGLLGIAFHPEFKANGQFYVHYSSSAKDMHSTVSRFQISKDDPTLGDPDSEEILFEEVQPYRNHNGGTLEFGPDGFLYASFGDGGKANDPHGHGQNLSTIFGSIIRIDVNGKDEGLEYAIPKDNPFVKTKDARPEIWAHGLRNVWQFSFDRDTGELWAGDVGQNKFEAVYLITKGGNYGWNRLESGKPFNKKTELVGGKSIDPIAIYGHQWGLSITGGNIYRGKKYPELNGKYFYADYASGNLWAISKNESEEYKSELVRRTGRSIACFGEDRDGEVYACSFDGSIYRIVPSAEPENSLAEWPKVISKAGIFASIKKQTFTDDYHPYEVNAPFWSDGAVKKRLFQIPEGEKIQYRENGSWEVPVGTKIVKHFQRFDKMPIETRLIVRTNTGWEAATYVWNRERTEAELLPEGKQFELWQPVDGNKRKWQPSTWHSPSSSECASCHTEASGYVLGMNTAQLNRTQKGAPKNQISQWIEEGLLDIETFDSEKAMAYCSPFDEKEDVAKRARILLDVNCAMCHRPNGPGNANIDLRFATEIEKTNLIGTKPSQTDLGIENGKIIAAGEPDRSLLLHRMETLGQGRMPTIGSNIADQQAIAVIKQWIEGMKAKTSPEEK